MKIKNPTDSDIEIQFKGIKYSVPANGELNSVPEEVAKFWKTSIHEFIVISKDSTDAVVAPVAMKVEEEVKEVIEEAEVIEEVKQPVVKTTPLKAKK